MATYKQILVASKKIARLQKMAGRAARARAAFKNALYKAKAHPGWIDAAIEAFISPDAGPNDWMA